MLTFFHKTAITVLPGSPSPDLFTAKAEFYRSAKKTLN